ncbi:MAG: zinc ribbon domain-containing protein [Nitrosomonas sp.]|nr:zinc ribbon domain-containing protein [Nitrosomonas sp.]
MLCPKCGTENTEQAESCINCGATLKEEVPAEQLSEQEAAPVHPRLTNIDMQSSASMDSKPVVSAALYVAVITGTLIFPIIGVIMGFTYLRKTDPEARKIGKTWLAFGIVFLLIQVVLVILR